MSRRGALRVAVPAAAALLAGCSGNAFQPPSAARPHILLVVADDLGYSDLGCFGGEIETPNLDALARAGLRAEDFYVSPRGAPSRAMLLTGVDHHQAGFGGRRAPGRAGDELPPGTEGRLSDRVVTVATLLREAGYATVMAGKWELGSAPAQRPATRGFERSFALHDGAASHWADMTSAIPGRERALYTRDGEELAELAPDHYSSRAFADFVIEGLDAFAEAGRPFFAYLAFQAPHGPLAAPDEWLERCRGRYDAGYDATRRARLLRMKAMGLVEEDVRPYPGLPTVPRWDDLDEAIRRRQSRKMELYCAMVENLDFQVGRIVERLEAQGRFEDTLVVFLSDNGASAADRGLAGMDGRDREWLAERFPVTDVEQWGGPGSFVEAGPAWAQVSMVPFRLFKGTLAEGGIRSPLIVAGPGVEAKQPLVSWLPRRARTTEALGHVTDLVPTILELAGVEHPGRRGGARLAPLRGRSLVPLWSGRLLARRGPHEFLGFELGGDRAGRAGRWKIVWMDPPFGAGRWRLYRIDLDPAELHDLSERRAEELEELRARWRGYARRHGVRLPQEEADGGAAVEAAAGPAPPAQKSRPSAR